MDNATRFSSNEPPPWPSDLETQVGLIFSGPAKLNASRVRPWNLLVFPGRLLASSRLATAIGFRRACEPDEKPSKLYVELADGELD